VSQNSNCSATVLDLAHSLAVIVGAESAQLRQMAGRVKQGGPGYEEAASLLRQAAEKLVAARIVAARRMGQPTPQLT